MALSEADKKTLGQYYDSSFDTDNVSNVNQYFDAKTAAAKARIAEENLKSQSGITLVKDENGETISMGQGQALFGFTFNDGTFVETGFGREGALAAQAIANDSNNGTLDKAQTFSNSSALQTLEAKANRTQAQIIADFADLKFLAQNTGVSSNLLNTEKRALGLDLNDPFAASTFLNEKGYSVGSTTDFYGDNAGPTDAAAKILNDKWQQSKLVQEKLDEEGKGEILINNNVANSLHLAAELSKQNISPASTNAIIRSDYGVSNVPSGGSIVDNPETGKKEFKPSIATDTDGRYNMLEWDRFLKEDKKEKEKEVDTGGSGASNTTSDIVYQTNPETQDTSTQPKVFTMDPNTLGIPSEAIMPTFNPSRVGTGVSTMPAETFTDQVQNQVTDLQSREADQATFYQPQTIAEKTEAGEDTSAFAITQKLFRNSATGQQIYIPFYGDQPQYPIPAGYYEVDKGGTQFKYPMVLGSQTAQAYNPVSAGGNTFTANNQGGMTQGFSGEDGSVVTESPSLMEQLYGTVSFQNPMNPAQTVTQTPAEYTQSLLNKQAQATFNPASSVAMPGVAQMYEQRIDPTTGKAVDAMPGTVIESTAGQSIATAPIIKSDQLAQVSDVYQSRGPGSAEIKDASGAIVADAIPIPGAAQMNLTQAAPAVSKVLQGGTTVNYQGMADAIDGANWDVTTGTFNMNDVQFTPDQFVAANNLNLGDYMTTTGGLQPATQTALSDSVTGKQQQRQKIDPSTGKGIVDAAGNPVMETYTSMEDAVAAQGRATEVGVKQKADPVTGELMVDANGNPVMERVLPKRTLDQTAGASELITGTGVDQSKVQAAFGTGEVGAASIQDELTTLMAQFEGGETPAWAAGAMRNATAIMNERGLGASSMAGQAIIQAAMEAALPIAQIDTANKQQVALFKAEQRAKFLGIEFDQTFQAKVQNAARVSEIANINFNAEQQIALENSRAANTMNLNNLNNEQALVMAEAAALSQLDMAGLSNLQQAEVQNAQNFLAIDMASMNNKQSTALFKAQQTTNSMMTDVAAANAAAQFNATSENQTTQFMSNLTSQISQFNAAQQNAINQFNAKEANAVVEFNSALQNQREMFNAQNYLVVAQANAQWRQSINTANTASQNVANLTYAKEVNGLTQKGLDDYWQKERDIMSYIFAQSENSAERAIKVLLGEQDLTGIREQLDQKDNASKAAWWSRAFFGDKGLTDLLKLKI